MKTVQAVFPEMMAVMEMVGQFGLFQIVDVVGQVLIEYGKFRMPAAEDNFRFGGLQFQLFEYKQHEVNEIVVTLDREGVAQLKVILSKGGNIKKIFVQIDVKRCTIIAGLVGS
jgi:hypothetical protein